MKSLPSRERGLKFLYDIKFVVDPLVAPFAGAWIEIEKQLQDTFGSCVAPFAGAWIEIIAWR